MLAHDVTNAARAAGHEPVGLSRAELDITDRDAVSSAVDGAAAECVINCAAFTDVDGCESREDEAHAVNGSGAGILAAAATAAGAWTLHVSSDYVFDGTKSRPYVESDPVGPMSAYGRSKLAGESAVAEAAPGRHTIVRSSWLFGAHGRSFPATILRLAGERDQLTVVDDQVGCPTFTGHLGRALVELVERRPSGIVHVAGAGQCSWFEFAREIVRLSGRDCEVMPGKTADMARPAPRPAYSVLGTERMADVPRLAPWQQGLAEFMSLAVAS
jgi:dTDP-4-dehydrorhamnose reductase